MTQPLDVPTQPTDRPGAAPRTASVGVEFELTRQEYAEALRSVWSRFGVLRQWLAVLIVLSVAGALTSNVTLTVVAGSGMALLGWFWKTTPREFDRNRRISAERTVVFGPDGVRVTLCRSEIAASWDAYDEVLDTPSLYVFLEGRASFLPVPKRAFASQPEEDAFRVLVRRHLPVRVRDE